MYGHLAYAYISMHTLVKCKRSCGVWLATSLVSYISEMQELQWCVFGNIVSVIAHM